MPLTARLEGADLGQDYVELGPLAPSPRLGKGRVDEAPIADLRIGAMIGQSNPCAAGDIHQIIGVGLLDGADCHLQETTDHPPLLSETGDDGFRDSDAPLGASPYDGGPISQAQAFGAKLSQVPSGLMGPWMTAQPPHAPAAPTV